MLAQPPWARSARKNPAGCAPAGFLTSVLDSHVQPGNFQFAPVERSFIDGFHSDSLLTAGPRIGRVSGLTVLHLLRV